MSASIEDELVIAGVDTMEQTAVPMAAMWYPPLSKESFIITANNQVITIMDLFQMIQIEGANASLVFQLVHHSEIWLHALHRQCILQDSSHAQTKIISTFLDC